jgi:hypothetical protein
VGEWGGGADGGGVAGVAVGGSGDGALRYTYNVYTVDLGTRN